MSELGTYGYTYCPSYEYTDPGEKYDRSLPAFIWINIFHKHMDPNHDGNFFCEADNEPLHDYVAVKLKDVAKIVYGKYVISLDVIGN